MRTSLVLVVVACCVMSACSRPKPEKQQANASSLDLSGETRDTSSRANADRRAIFDALLAHVLMEPKLKDSRESYGTPGDRRFGLVSNSDYGVPWPDWYIPSVENFQSTRVSEGVPIDESQPRLLGVRLDKFNLDDEVAEDDFRMLEGQIQITLLNAGGTGGGPIQMGGCIIYYDAQRHGDRWTVRCNGLLDP